VPCSHAIACLEVGTREDLVDAPLLGGWREYNPIKTSRADALHQYGGGGQVKNAAVDDIALDPSPPSYAGGLDRVSRATEWVTEVCMGKEITWSSNLHDEVSFVWIPDHDPTPSVRGTSPGVSRLPPGVSQYGEPNPPVDSTHGSRLGHRWEVWRAGSPRDVLWKGKYCTVDAIAVEG
jgi:hypothetical protein